MTTGSDASNMENWAAIVIKIWQQNIIKLKIGEYRLKRKVSYTQLYNSFTHHVIRSSGGDVQKIEFAFKLYGKFVDMGVGREMSIGNSGNVETTRKRKKWYSKSLYSEVMKLREYYKQKIGAEASFVMFENLNGAFGDDMKKTEYKKRSSGYFKNRVFAAQLPDGRKWVPSRLAR